MQCPPTPGPGLNLVNPKGFVSAAFNTENIFMRNLLHNILNSFERPIFTERNEFSNNSEVSAILIVSHK